MEQISHSVKTRKGERKSSAGSGSLRILCVEDNEGDFILVREHLKDAAFEMETILSRAVSFEDARMHLENTGENGDGDGAVDLVLLDLSLPDSFGPETLNQVREIAPGIPVIVLSGNEDRELAVDMVQRGAQDYLPKNAINGDLLLRSILYALERQRSQREMEALNKRLRKATEDLKTAQMQLIQAEKLDSLGRLAAGVAHEVKNPLATLQMGVDYFSRKEELMGESGKMMVDHMQEAIENADRIIHGMLEYSRSDALELELRNINAIVSKALRMVRHEVVRNNIDVQRNLTVPIPAVRVDQGKIEQVFINVLINAIQSMTERENGRVLEVRTFWDELQEIDRDLGIRHYERLRVQDRVVVVEIRDRGAGIPQEKLTRIFEPFFTTKPTGEGTGLGLSVVKNIVDLHRGHIEVANVDDPQGLRVRIYLKAYEIKKNQNQSRPGKTAGPG